MMKIQRRFSFRERLDKKGMRCWLVLTVGLAVSSTPAQTQTPAEYVAFQVDGGRVIANLIIREAVSPQIMEGLSAVPVAKLGYQYFELPKWWDIRSDITAGDRWFLHTSPTTVVPAIVERLVGGYAGCQAAIGVLLTVAQEDLKASSERYFIATATPPALSSPASVYALGAAPLTPEIGKTLESTLNRQMLAELPRVRAEAAPHLTREAREGSYRARRAWAKQRLQIEEDMQASHGKLRYDVQAFQLSPNGVPVYFVRAEWLVGNRQGFAMTMWARGGRQFQVLELDTGSARWMRSSLYPAGVNRENLGLILNVFDRDRDGWGEVLFAQQGYESSVIRLFEYSETGFMPTGVEFSGGC